VNGALKFAVLVGVLAVAFVAIEPDCDLLPIEHRPNVQRHVEKVTVPVKGALPQAAVTARRFVRASEPIRESSVIDLICARLC
jgi:hypothetical protein